MSPRLCGYLTSRSARTWHLQLTKAPSDVAICGFLASTNKSHVCTFTFNKKSFDCQVFVLPSPIDCRNMTNSKAASKKESESNLTNSVKCRLDPNKQIN